MLTAATPLQHIICILFLLRFRLLCRSAYMMGSWDRDRDGEVETAAGDALK